MASRSRPRPEWALAIRRRRKGLGLTQRDLADLSGTGLAFIYSVERGKASLQLDKLLSVLEVLGFQLNLEEGDGRFAVSGARGE